MKTTIRFFKGGPFIADPLKPKRWILMVTYRCDHGSLVCVQGIEELDEVHALIEYGPDWNCITDFKTALHPNRRGHSLSVEGSGLL